ncbi:zinc finger protein 626-like isoform X2 [Aricia agestis]|uniref:zinc finger protein 626-like isoform X2 n=1 Tax=Aricia agestis TaxID=91739 RepID=UPI001C20245F|nr:zinc finger protein 626-like isoform X2 [Aricia agestis]
MEEKPSTLCRICLQDGAKYPIFEKGEGSILKKLSMCLNEKFEDVEGYPRNICDDCNNILDTICNFINKYKSTNTILQTGLHLQSGLNIKKIKQETEYFSGDEQTEELEINFENVKYEADNDYGSDFSDNDIERETLQLINMRKKPSASKSTKGNIGAKRKGNMATNKVASSMLEGEFVWNGRYCFKQYKDNPDIPVYKKTKGRQPALKVKVEKVKEPLPPKLCDLCGEVFKTQEKLSTHKRKKHIQREIKCPHCPKILASNFYLVRHVKRKHDGSKDFVCSACGKAFAFRGELTTHIRKVHDKTIKKKKYTCKICNKDYNCQKSVTIHERSVHTGDRPAVCNVCGTSFYHEDYLKEHMRLHTGETPFKCPVCGRGYAQRGNMKSHLRIHRISELDSVTLSKIKPNYLKLLKP